MPHVREKETGHKPLDTSSVYRSLPNVKKGIIFVEILGREGAHHESPTGVLNGEELSSLLQSEAMTMVESPTYYRAYRPVLQALQEMEPERLPFKVRVLGILPVYLKDALVEMLLLCFTFTRIWLQRMAVTQKGRCIRRLSAWKKTARCVLCPR